MSVPYSTPPPALLIRDLSAADKPREKLLGHGPRSLSDAEIIAILLGSGLRGRSALDLARRLLLTVGHDLHALARLQPQDLRRLDGVGEAKAARIVAALELGRRREAAAIVRRPVLDHPAATFRYLRPLLGDLIYEEFFVLCLNRANELIGQERISTGGVTSTVADAKRIFRAALRHGATTSLVLAHNHPSGQARPSEADIRLTRKISAGARHLDLCVVDHLIVAGETFYSFADDGVLDPEEDQSEKPGRGDEGGTGDP